MEEQHVSVCPGPGLLSFPRPLLVVSSHHTAFVLKAVNE